MKAPGAWHPAILKHPANGKPTLYLGRRRNSYIEGLSRAESDALLEELWAHCTQPQFLYEHVWRLGDLVMWDNRSTMHRRDPFDGDGAPHHASHPDQGQRQAHRVCGVNDSHAVVPPHRGGAKASRRVRIRRSLPPAARRSRLRSGRRNKPRKHHASSEEVLCLGLCRRGSVGRRDQAVGSRDRRALPPARLRRHAGAQGGGDHPAQAARRRAVGAAGDGAAPIT